MNTNNTTNNNPQVKKLVAKKPEARLLFMDTRAELAKFRSSSAPPEQMADMEPTTPLTNDRDQFRSDPAYFQFYYSQRLLNPRLPPPIARDWSNDMPLADHSNNGFSQQQYQYDNNNSYLDAGNAGWGSPDAKGKRSSVVDRIQEDFPRTPSPVYRESKRHGNQLAFGDEEQYNSYQQQQNVSPMFFPGNRSSGDDMLSQQMGNMSLDKHRKPQPTNNNPNYYSGQQPQQQFNRQFNQQQQPIQNGPYPYYPPQNMPFVHGVPHQQGGYPPQFANNTPMSPVMAEQYGSRAPVPQQGAQYQQQFYGAGQSMAPQQPSQSTAQQSSGSWNQQQAQQAAPAQSSSPQAENPPQRRTNQSSNAAQGRSTGGSSRGSTGSKPTGKQAAVEAVPDNQAPRSKLMEEFKSGRGRKFELKDIVGHVVEFSKDQHGSRFIQQKLETATPEEKEMIFKEVAPHALKLITDVFGNYVIQKMFEYGLPSHKKAMAKSLKGHVLSLTLQTYGCRVIQKALEVIENADKRELSSELDGHVMKCIQDQNGNHVIQKCIEKMPASLCQFIVDAFQGNIVSQAVHAYGCRVIQRILEHCNEQQTQQILDEILENVHKLVKDQYGNYVVQHVLERGIERHKTAIIRSLKGCILTLSYNKYASNVIEKCFQYGQRKERNDMIDEIIGKGSGKDISQSPLFEMMKDKFANYVIQKVIEMADDSQRKTLFDVMKPQANAIRKLTFGKHIIAVVEKYCGPLGA